MPHKMTPRYQPAYRRVELDLILSSAQRGESLSFVGIAGVGKSNIVNYLRSVEKSELHFPVVDATQWNPDQNNLWSLMLSAATQATHALPEPDAPKVLPLDDSERMFENLKSRLAWVCQQLNQKVMFVLDDFDRVLEQIALPELEKLNVLRSDGNREKLSYLVMTKRLPHILGRDKSLNTNSKFYDLLRPNIYALEPYTPDDAGQMLHHLNDSVPNPLSKTDLVTIYKIAGRHARLLKIVFETWIKQPVTGPRSDYFANQPDVRQECKRILEKLHRQEQEACRLLAAGNELPDDYRDTADHLMRRGVLTSLEPPVWFSPLFAAYLKDVTEGRE